MLDQTLLDDLRSLAGKEHLLTDPAECWPYGYDNSRLHVPPDAVVFAKDQSQILELIRFCNQHRIPLTPRGRGTGTTGGTVPLAGGIVLSLERMDRIIALDPANRIMKVEPGVTNQTVQDAAAEHGFFWPPDPTSAA
jgi:D-lactate dehydrogenase